MATTPTSPLPQENGMNGSTSPLPKEKLTALKKKRKEIPKLIAGQKGIISQGKDYYKPIRNGNMSEFQLYSMINQPLPENANPLLKNLQKLRDFTIPFLGLCTGSEIDPSLVPTDRYVHLRNIVSTYRRPAMIDIKIGLPSQFNPTHKAWLREGTANLLGCYVHGVTSDKVTFKNHVNEYDGRRVPIDHFDRVLQTFFGWFSKKIQEAIEKGFTTADHAPRGDIRREIIKKTRDLIKVLDSLKGFRFVSSSLFIIFEQDFTSVSPEDTKKDLPIYGFYLIDFERVLYLGPPTPEIPLPATHTIPSASSSCAENEASLSDVKATPVEPNARPAAENTTNNNANAQNALPQFNQPNPSPDKGDEAVMTSLKHILYAMRTSWIGRPPTIYLVRHGERYDYTDFEWAPTATHPHDAPLSAAGLRQGQDLVDRLLSIQPALIVAAPMQRAIMTCEPLARRLRWGISVEPGVVEFLCNKTRKKVPELISSAVSISPWVDMEYEPVWKEGLHLETWPAVLIRTGKTMRELVKRCEGKGDLVIISHRSTLQTVHRVIMGPNWEGETKLEYGGLSMFVKEDDDDDEDEEGGEEKKKKKEELPAGMPDDIFLEGKWTVQTFNELNFLRDRIRSPSSNPFRHIEGYYEDLEWGSYASTASLWEGAASNKDNNLAGTSVTTTETSGSETNGTSSNHTSAAIGPTPPSTPESVVTTI